MHICQHSCPFEINVLENNTITNRDKIIFISVWSYTHIHEHMHTHTQFTHTHAHIPTTDMGLGKSEKGGKWCGGLGAAVGPQWGPGAKPLVGVWGQRPQKLKFFSVCHQKKQHSGAWKSDICKSASFMFRPDIYLIILKIALKMSFWCSKNKILAKVSNYLTVGILL